MNARLFGTALVGWILVMLGLSALGAGPGRDESARAALEMMVDNCLPCHHPGSGNKKAVRAWPNALDLPATLAAKDLVTPGDAEDSLLFLMVDDGDIQSALGLGRNPDIHRIVLAHHLGLVIITRVDFSMPAQESLDQRPHNE